MAGIYQFTEELSPPTYKGEREEGRLGRAALDGNGEELGDEKGAERGDGRRPAEHGGRQLLAEDHRDLTERGAFGWGGGHYEETNTLTRKLPAVCLGPAKRSRKIQEHAARPRYTDRQRRRSIGEGLSIKCHLLERGAVADAGRVEEDEEADEERREVVLAARLGGAGEVDQDAEDDGDGGHEQRVVVGHARAPELVRKDASNRADEGADERTCGKGRGDCGQSVIFTTSTHCVVLKF